MSENIDKIIEDVRKLADAAADYGLSGWKGHGQINAIADRLATLRAAPAAEGARMGGGDAPDYRRVLKYIVDVMGPKVPPCCEGCEFEWGAALDAAKEALAAAPSPAAEGAAPQASAGEDCGCQEPAFTEPMEALRFLSGRFKHAGVSEGVALSYARDIDAILSAPAAAPAPVEGMVLVPRERLQYALDLLTERKYGNSARSPGHNAQHVIGALLAAPTSAATPELSLDFPGLGRAGPFAVPSDGVLTLPEATMADLTHYFRQGYEAKQPEAAHGEQEDGACTTRLAQLELDIDSLIGAVSVDGSCGGSVAATIKRRIADARREEGLRREEWARRQPAAAPGAVDALREAMMGVSESLCELEVQARNASRAPSLGGIDEPTVRRMFDRLATSLEVQQEAIHVALAQQPPASGSRGVDEAMLMRACNAYFDALPVHGGDAADRDAMRAALEAALATPDASAQEGAK
jgi:hypothetical protein